MTTYAIRQDHYADNDQSFYVYTITGAGMAHHFGDDMSAGDAESFAADLSKLAPESVARLVGDAS